MWFVTYWCWFVVCDIYICFVVYMEKQKTKKKEFERWLPRVPVLWHSGKRDFYKKKQISSPSAWTSALGKEYLKKKFKNLSRVLHSGKKIKKKQRRPPANGVKFSPSASTALGKAFPECTIFDTRGRRLSRERISRRLFPECCTRGRLLRVQLGLPECNRHSGNLAVPVVKKT